MSDSRMKADSRSAIAFGPSVARADLGRSNCRCGKAASLANGNCSGFTLVELLVVIGIIVILIGILIPTISHVRTAARAASTQSLLVELQSAIEQYYQDYRAYPGPLSNDVMYAGFNGATGPVSMSENLVLGLMGGLNVTGGGAVAYDPALVGTGPRTLAAAGMNTNRVKNPYIASTADITTSSQNSDPANPGHFRDGVGSASDSTIPEFVDRFQSPMPILYLRARVGAPTTVAGPQGPIVISDVGDPALYPNGVRMSMYPRTPDAQYDIRQYFGYVGCFRNNTAWPNLQGVNLDGNDRPAANSPGAPGISIGEGKNITYWYGGQPYSIQDEGASRGAYHGLLSILPRQAGAVGDTNVEVPFSAAAYFRNPAFGLLTGPQADQNQPRGRDAYILISPGPDRVYGTADDITSFGAVLP